MKLDVGISDVNRKNVVDILNITLSDEFVLYTKTRNFHWHVTGMQFNDLHKFFEAQYEELNGFVDDVAERARTLGGHSYATLAEFGEHTRLKEQPAKVLAPKEMLAALLNDHETLIRALRKDLEACANKYEDMGTSDFLTGLMEKHEKMAWMLRSFIE